jgi:6-phospho-beta-glucosidase
MRVTVVGGASTYTPELIEGLADRSAVLPVDELVLHDVDLERLGLVGGAARRILSARGWAGSLTLTDDLDAALEGASFCLVQLRVGGQQARLRDESIPPQFGIVGQETTGPGGFAKAMRTVPVVLEVAERFRIRGAPDGWIIDFTNPVGIVTQALVDAGHRAVGLCNMAIGVQRAIAGGLGIEPSRIELRSIGLNHASWFNEVLLGGRTILADLLRDPPAELVEKTGHDAAAMRRVGMIPSSYQAYYAEPERALERQRRHGARAREVMDIERRLLDAYANETLTSKPAILAERGGAWYSEAALDLMAALRADEPRHLVVDVRNDGAMPDVSPDQVVEVTCAVDRDGPRPLPAGRLRPEQQQLVEALIDYQRRTIQAALTRDRATAVEAMAANPLVPSRATAEALVTAMIEGELARV